MAFRFNGGIIIKSTSLLPNFIIPSTVNFQVRNAARKGYREKARKKLMAQKLNKITTQKEGFQIKKKNIKIEKTVEPQKPDPPNDDVFIAGDFKLKKYSLIEAIKFHQEYHHPTVFNNPSAPVSVRIEFNMIGKKKTQVLKPFKGLAGIPHPFSTEMKREVLVFCGPEHVTEAIESGGTTVGGSDLVNKIKTGYIQPNLYEYVLCHSDFLPLLTPIRGILKTQMPRPKNGTLTSDFKKAIPRFLHGIEYACVKQNPTDDFGIVNCQVGSINMKPEHVEENMKALIKDIQQFRPNREGSFVSWIWCRSPPSKEEFALNVSLYEDSKQADFDDDDDDDEDDDDSGRSIRERQLEAENDPDETDIKLEDKI